MFRSLTSMVLAACVIAAGPAAFAQFTDITYQGVLQSGGAGYTGTADFVFTLFDAESGGNNISGGFLPVTGVNVNDGLFTATATFGSAAFNGQPLWLDIRVNTPSNGGAGPYTVLTPRQRILPAPYAIHAANASVSGAQPNAVQFTSNSNTFAGSGASLHSLNASSISSGVMSLSGSHNTHIVRGINSSTTSQAAGVRGNATASTGQTYGGRFESASSAGRGVHAIAPHTGIYASSTASSGVAYGGRFECASTAGNAVQAVSSATSGFVHGGRFETNSTSGFGVSGWALATSGTTRAGYFVNSSTSGYGVQGIATAFSGNTVGVQGEANSTSGIGVRAHATSVSGTTHAIWAISDSTSGRGIYAVVTPGSGTNYGVAGQTNSASGWGVYSFGNTGASGTKSFRIDHPSDPANKYLQHYSAEGPEPQNIYNGVVELNELGEAIVHLPEYFNAINRDPRYTLTPIGAAMPNLHIAQKVEGNTFRIAGGAAGKEVSWEVKAIRDDAWVRTHGAPVEVLKDDVERGTYQHPELHGQPVERGLMYHPPVQRTSDRAPLVHQQP